MIPIPSSLKRTKIDSSKAEKEKQMKKLVEAVKECSPSARSLTVLQVCDLVDKYKEFDHRLPCLALAATCESAVFNESLSSFSSDLTIGRQEAKRRGKVGQLQDDVPLHGVSPTNPSLSVETISKLIDSLDTLIIKKNQACFNVPERDAIGGQCISIKAVGELGRPLVKVLDQERPRKDAILGSAMPLIEEIRVHPGVDGRPHFYSRADKSAGNAALTALGKVCERFPFIQRYLDPPHVLAIQTMTAPPNVAQHFPAGRLVPSPVDPVDGNAPAGLISLVGDETDARWAADLLRSHYRDVGGKGGGPSPLPVAAPANVRIMSFATTGGGLIQYH